MTIAYKTLKKSFPLGVFSATFLVALTGQASLAFTVNPLGPLGALNKWTPQELYTLGGNTVWTVNLKQPFTTIIDEAKKTEFKTYLDKSIFGKSVADGGLGWTFNLAPKDLAGSFNILNYVACGPETTCKSNLGLLTVGGVGAFIDIEYKPGTGDPALGFDQTTLNGIHWIQRIVDNHAFDNDHGVDEDIIDIESGQNNPYYDLSYRSDMSKGLFSDKVHRDDNGENHDWSGDLFLVQQTAPKTVTIYNGVKWGWTNFCTLPQPAQPKSLSLFAEADASGSCQDFGDAPDSYQTYLASNGPRYQEGDLQLLGNLWDTEKDGQPTPLANGDDIKGGCQDCGIDPDDEDGVIFGDSWVDVTFNITRPDPNPYQLRAWWDTNYNGVFDHTSELYIDDLLDLSPGMFTKRYNLGFDPKADGLYSRFRLTLDPLDPDVKPFGEYYSKTDCNATDAANENCTSHGEVEDYVHVPEPSSALSLLAFGTLSAASTLKRKLKPSKTSEKETTKVG